MATKTESAAPEVVQPTMIISQNREEAVFQQMEARGVGGMPTQGLEYSPRGLPYAVPNIAANVQDLPGDKGEKPRRGVPDCADVQDKINFIWSNLDDMETKRGVHGLGVLVRRDAPGFSGEAAKYIHADYFGPDGRVTRGNQKLVAVDREAEKAQIKKTYAPVYGRLQRSLPQSAGNDGRATDQTVVNTLEKEIAV